MGAAQMSTFTKRAGAVVAILVSAMTFALAQPAQAQELAPEHLAIARKYVDLTDRTAIYEVTMVETGLDTMRQILSQNPAIGEQTDIAIGRVLESYVGQKGELLDQFARLYALRFTREELEQIVAFYESPVGQKLSVVNVSIQEDVQIVMQVFRANLRQEFFARVRAELREQGVNI